MGGGAFYSFAVDATHEAGYEAYGDGDLKVNVANDAGPTSTASASRS